MDENVSDDRGSSDHGDDGVRVRNVSSALWNRKPRTTT
jgi:hypothetical protein